MRQPVLLDEQIAQNRRQTVVLFLVTFAILGGLAFAVGVILGYPPIFTGIMALIIGLIYIATTSKFSVDLILRSAKAREANPKVFNENRLINIVEEMAIAAQLPKPKVYVSPSRDINAFATGKDPEHGVICITAGALELLDREELQGVIAHELAHIANYDIRIKTYTVALIGTIAMLSEITIRMMFFGGGNRDSKVHPLMIVLAIVLVIVGPILGRIVHLAISRQREYMADATGAMFTRNPEGLARALEKIAGTPPDREHAGEKTVASLYIANPFKRVSKSSIWATHPPIEDRVRRLRGR